MTNRVEPLYAVGRTDCTGEVKRFSTLAEAEAAIAGIEAVDPAGVEAGNYYIDAPEFMPRYSVMDMSELNVRDLLASIDAGDVLALVDEVAGGIIGYVLISHADRITETLNREDTP